jgi:hypothetical protein
MPKGRRWVYQIKSWSAGRRSLGIYGGYSKIKKLSLSKDPDRNGSKRKMLIQNSFIVV